MIVVTGSSGFIGRQLVEHLRQRAHRVVGIDRLAQGGSEQLVADVSEPDADARAALAEADAVVHLAGCPGVRDRSPDVGYRRWRDNVVATEQVLAATPHRTPVVVASSSSVYGGSRAGRPSAEHDRLRPVGGYARSKHVVEQACAARRARGGHVTIVRPFTVVGPGQRADMALARWMAAAASGRPLDVYGSLERRRDFTDVRAVVRALALLTELDPTVLNLGAGRSRSLGELVAAVRARFGDTGLVVTRRPGGEPDETLADTTRSGDVLGFSLHTDLHGVIAAQATAARLAPTALVA
jgi:nucleoside-diphosphate-sugar epimerase